ncbi:hypothetical protein BHE74_00045396 [Ensete ventricosum]|nr:hypothetical protein BHE74_00045396 [Ensete ventricosum]
MRTGVCTVQQALTAEVAAVLKHSLDLARRRGHGQVTPLHVAATLMSSSSASSDLLRRACLRSQPHHPASHPLRCRALELCFNNYLLRLSAEQSPPHAPKSSLNEDLRVVLEVMLRKEGRRSNTVVVGDSASMTEGLVAELMGRVERGEVPDELKHASFVNLQFSCVQLRLMSKGDVDLKVSDLRRTINSLAGDRVGGGVIIHAGDLSWAVHEEAPVGCGFNAVQHMVAEMGRLLSEFKSSNSNGVGGGSNKVWLLASANYETYMKCQMRQPSLEMQWALQAVVVPSGWLGLSLQASSGLFSSQNKNLIEPHPVSFSATSLKLNAGFSSTAVDKKNETGNWQERTESNQWLSEASLNSLKMAANQQAMTALALYSPLYSDSATSKDQTRRSMAEPLELGRQLQENIPWQSEAIPSIVEALHDCRNGDKKVVRLLIQGNDHVAKRRLARVMAESFFGSPNKLIQINQRNSSTTAEDSSLETLIDALRKEPKCVVLIEDVNRMHCNFVNSFTDAVKVGSFKDSFGGEVSLGDAIFVLTTSKLTKFDVANNVVNMRFCIEDSSPRDAKRKPETDLQNISKKGRTGESSFDLNMQPSEDSEEDAVPSDLTHETECISLHLPQELLESTVQLTLDAGSHQFQEMKLNLLSKLHRAFEEIPSDNDEKGHLFIDPAVGEELMEASGSFSESFFEQWVREVFRVSLQSIKRRRNVRLSLEGEERHVEESGFMGSVLPHTIHVD